MPAEKLNYLKACLSGDAEKLLASFTITDSNYELAKKTLIERYDNNKLIVRAHISELMQVSVTKEPKGTERTRNRCRLMGCNYNFYCL